MPHMDLSWYLTSSPGDADIRLARTVQRVLACRYQPARLDAAATARQQEEAQVCEALKNYYITFCISLLYQNFFIL